MSKEDPRRRPNIIILNPDEMRSDSLGHLGNPAAHTPRMDALAREEGVSFSNAFCQNPVCVPSRCSFLTGLYPHTRGHRTMRHLLHQEEKSLFSELKDAGYYVWINGRGDLYAGQVEGLDKKHADEVYFYDKNEKITPVNPLTMKQVEAQKKEKRNPYMCFEGVVEMDGGPDVPHTLGAIDAILNRTEPNKPLCLFLGWMNPHPEYRIEKKYRDLIDADKIPDRIDYQSCVDKSLMLQKIHELSKTEDVTEEEWRELRAVYLAQCAKVDEMVGMVCDALKEAGEYDNSAIFILSDHGDFTGDYSVAEKAQNSFENCLVKVPLLIKPPKWEKADPGVSESLTELVDFYATVLDYAGVEPSETHFGYTLRPVIEDRSMPNRQYVFCEGGRNPGETHCDEWHSKGGRGPAVGSSLYPKVTAQKDDNCHEKGTMIFDGRIKYIHRPSGRDELYDLFEDPGECRNIIASADQELLYRLKSKMLDWYQQTCDIVPKKLDERNSFEQTWTFVRGICPPGKEEKVREYLKTGVEWPDALRYCVELWMQIGKEGNYDETLL
ncbi:MAG: sulfatase-like hydrolase/transferase [Faecalicatena sp.]|uniref:sulfatase-like hydrolase/transferase n=1 Tax=Faecalicatena sp. TaxID=2005360 RepID=UPI0025907539|nr:sulfatase-like hydrolase/transferase [Faecalicatena sp.]MCI6467881.1 sulfatase-like hydrolase/transferase [Faecalicatena sp.]MDY5619477.1 sulfatase-like hydrolase/transferase [Lachnospiraceae bacterium]